MPQNPFADLIPAQPAAAPKVSADNPFADLIPAGATFDQRFGEMQAPTQRTLANAVTDIPGEIANAAGEAVSAIKGGVKTGGKGIIEGVLDTGRAVIGVPQLVLSPITGLSRAVGGNLMAQAVHGAGMLINPEVARRDDMESLYQAAKSDVDTALAAARAGKFVKTAAPEGLVRHENWPKSLKEFVEQRRSNPNASDELISGKYEIPETAPSYAIERAPAAPAAAAPTASEGSRVVDAAQRVAEVTGAELAVPRAIASDSTAVQRIGQGIRNIPVVGDRIPQATARLVEDLGGAVRTVADQYGAGTGPNVANRIGRTIERAAAEETAAATNAARQSDEAVLAAWQRATDEASQAVAAREAEALDASRRAVGDMSPQDMGAALIQRLRAGEQAARAEKEALYGRAGSMDAAVRADEVANVRSRVAQHLDNLGTVVDPQLTPAAAKMMDELQRLAELRIPNKAVGARLPAAGGEPVVGVSVQGLEQARKRLGFFRQAAANDADRRAAGQIMQRFDEWQSDAFERALMSGSDEALSAFRDARAANAAWRRRFHSEEDDAGRVIQQVVTGEVTPQEVANYIIGAGKVGAKGVSSRLLTRLQEATGGDAEAMQAIRGGIWNRLTQATEGAQARPAQKVADDIAEFLNGSGRDVANRLFSAQERGIMQAYAETVRGGQQARQTISDVAKATRPQEMQVGPGPMQQLADTVLGKGGRTDEALFSAIDAYAKSGGRADVTTLAKLVRALPAQDRGDLAGSIIRQLGVSPRSGEFSPDVFVSQWRSYTPQAKAILFGNAGAHRQALDDIATISERMKDIGKRFGNSSGTAQNNSFRDMAMSLVGAGAYASPLSAIGAFFGGAVAARILSAPAGASSAAKWSRAYEAFRLRPSPRSVAALQVATTNLVNTAQGIGVKADILRAIQGPYVDRSDRSSSH